ncbi:unnamed protein product, partial [marine sediment metagenome]
RQMNDRNEYLANLSEEEKNHDITVKPIQGGIPELLHFNDITTDKENWINRSVAEFYKIKSIKIDAGRKE